MSERTIKMRPTDRGTVRIGGLDSFSINEIRLDFNDVFPSEIRVTSSAPGTWAQMDSVTREYAKTHTEEETKEFNKVSYQMFNEHVQEKMKHGDALVAKWQKTFDAIRNLMEQRADELADFNDESDAAFIEKLKSM